ncbi:hypothetical protein ACFLTS_01690 [Chloroflexota bacterium]
MIEHIWTVLCSRVITDKESNNVSLLDVMEEITLIVQGAGSGGEVLLEKDRAILPFTLVLASLWSRKKTDKPVAGTAKDIVITPSGKILTENEFKVDLSNHIRMRTKRNLHNLPVAVNEPGRYIFRTELLNEKNKTWKKVSSIPFIIKTKTE